VNFDELLKVAEGAVREAVSAVDFSSPSIERYKDREHGVDFVTNVDLSIERCIMDLLKPLNIPFISEESFEVATHDLCWVLDPVDGTLNLKNGLPFYAVSLALVVDGRPHIGVIATPGLSDSIYFGSLGLGAFCDERPLKVSDKHPKDAVVAYDGFRGTEDHILPKIRGVVGRHRLLGSTATEMALCANGNFDAVVTPSSRFWDLAAGVALIKSAGGVAVSLKGEELSPFTDSSLVGGKEVVDAIVDALTK
jgi:myo-inositol-1(or 4)-monophosphatase